jgi:hypothetical protein
VVVNEVSVVDLHAGNIADQNRVGTNHQDRSWRRFRSGSRHQLAHSPARNPRQVSARRWRRSTCDIGAKPATHVLERERESAPTCKLSRAPRRCAVGHARDYGGPHVGHADECYPRLTIYFLYRRGCSKVPFACRLCRGDRAN